MKGSSREICYMHRHEWDGYGTFMEYLNGRVEYTCMPNPDREHVCTPGPGPI